LTHILNVENYRYLLFCIVIRKKTFKVVSNMCHGDQCFADRR